MMIDNIFHKIHLHTINQSYIHLDNLYTLFALFVLAFIRIRATTIVFNLPNVFHGVQLLLKFHHLKNDYE